MALPCPLPPSEVSLTSASDTLGSCPPPNILGSVFILLGARLRHPQSSGVILYQSTANLKWWACHGSLHFRQLLQILPQPWLISQNTELASLVGFSSPVFCPWLETKSVALYYFKCFVRTLFCYFFFPHRLQLVRQL